MKNQHNRILRVAITLVIIATTSWTATAPAPLLRAGGHPITWWFVFKLNAKVFPGCAASAARICLFGGNVQEYAYGQQFVYASSEHPVLQDGKGCLGDTLTDPLGATFNEIYNGAYHYVVWNDQFYDDPLPSRSGSWGHSKGLLAWNNDGEGLVLQVSTPSWPASGSKDHQRKHDGNTLGCVNDNDVKVSQHFFALKITKNDLARILAALRNASVVTDPTNPQIVNNGGPADIQGLVATLGTKSDTTNVAHEELSTGVMLIGKPPGLNVPPWLLVSSVLGSLPLRAATWWTTPTIPSTTTSTRIACWKKELKAPGSVAIATSGSWDGKAFSLKGGPGTNANHAKIGVTTDSTAHLTILGDLNQQGTIAGPNCASSQNGRGGLFYIVKNDEFWKSVTSLITGRHRTNELN